MLNSRIARGMHLTKVEIVVVAISEEHETANNVDKCCRTGGLLAYQDHLC